MNYYELNQAWAELSAAGAAFEMETTDISGVPTKVFRRTPQTVRNIWLPTRAFGDRDYIVFQNERVSYEQAHVTADAVANWLIAHGVRHGDRVAIAMRNYPEWMLIYWACVSIGVCVVGVNAWWTGNEIRYAIDDSMPKVIFCDRERLALMAPYVDSMIDTMIVVTRMDEPPLDAVDWRDVIETKGAMPAAVIAPEDDACIFYTSGTTGFPKGAVLTHRNCVTNIYNILFAGQAQAIAVRRGTGAAVSTASPAVTLIPTPFFHVTGNNCLAYTVTLSGGTMILMYKWDPTEALTLIERERITAVSGVPVMTREILNHPELKSFDTSSLTSIAGGGASFQQDLIGRVKEHVPTARARTGFGMTETSGSVTTISADFLESRPTSVGRLLPTFDYRLVDDDGNDVPDGSPGELLLRGGAVFKGYLNKPEATAETLAGGWLHTGDLARIDEDEFVHIVGRKKDIVIRGGENIYCAEVENSIQQHPDVAECCVFGLPDERLGEIVAAAIVLKPGVESSIEIIAAYCEGKLARHKIPYRIWFLDHPIPRNATGKFMKRELQQSLSDTTTA